MNYTEKLQIYQPKWNYESFNHMASVTLHIKSKTCSKSVTLFDYTETSQHPSSSTLNSRLGKIVAYEKEITLDNDSHSRIKKVLADVLWHKGTYWVYSSNSTTATKSEPGTTDNSLWNVIRYSKVPVLGIMVPLYDSLY